MDSFCPRCGSAARILLNLVGCLTPQCRNYEPKWVTEWSNKNKMHYQHHDASHRFLGSFETDEGIFDLYHVITQQNLGICFARNGNSLKECYYVDDRQTEVGNVALGQLAKVSKGVQSALKEALRRSPKNRNKKI